MTRIYEFQSISNVFSSTNHNVVRHAGLLTFDFLANLHTYMGPIFFAMGSLCLRKPF